MQKNEGIKNSRNEEKMSKPAYTEEYALNNLKMYYNILGRIPTKKDFKENAWCPSFGWYAVKFNSFANACNKAGIANYIADKSDRVAYSISKLIEIAQMLNKCPNIHEYDMYRERAYSRAILTQKLGMTYSDICLKYLPVEYGSNRPEHYNKDEIISHIFELYATLGRAPYYKETKYHANVYSNIFHLTYNHFLISIGLTPSATTPEYKTDDELLHDFLNFYNKYNRIPLLKEMNEGIHNLSDYPLYTRRFGSIKNVCGILNISYITKNNSFGVVCLDKLNNVCKSYQEKQISDFLIDNGLYLSKDPMYNELIEGDRRYFDWKIKYNNCIYYVEYFGMYRKNKGNKYIEQYRQKMNAKINDLSNGGFIDNCIFIFPEHFNNGIDKYFNTLFNASFELGVTGGVYSYADFSDKELLDIIMFYSSDKKYLPSYSELENNKKLLIRKEIIDRHGTYENFASLFNKCIRQKSRLYWCDDNNLFDIFEYMILKYNKILSTTEYINYNDPKLAGYRCAFGGMHDTFVNRKLKFLKSYVTNNTLLPKSEILWLHNIANNKGKGVAANRVTEEQQKIATNILYVIHKK